MFSRISQLLLLLFVGVQLAYAQTASDFHAKFGLTLTVSGQESALATSQLEDVRLRGGSLSSLLADLALDYDIPIGFEYAMNDSSFKEMRLKRDKITLSDLLNQLMADHREYSWEISDGVVHVFPKEGYRDPIVEQLLNVEIKTFGVKKTTLVWDVETTLLKTPEFKRVVDTNGLGTHGWSFSGFYFPHLGKNYTLDVSDTTVRAILDRIIKESPTAKFWNISRDSSDHTFSISLAALHEDTPKHLQRIDFDELEGLSYPLP